MKYYKNSLLGGKGGKSYDKMTKEELLERAVKLKVGIHPESTKEEIIAELRSHQKLSKKQREKLEQSAYKKLEQKKEKTEEEEGADIIEELLEKAKQKYEEEEEEEVDDDKLLAILEDTINGSIENEALYDAEGQILHELIEEGIQEYINDEPDLKIEQLKKKPKKTKEEKKFLDIIEEDKYLGEDLDNLYNDLDEVEKDLMKEKKLTHHKDDYLTVDDIKKIKGKITKRYDKDIEHDLRVPVEFIPGQDKKYSRKDIREYIRYHNRKPKEEEEEIYNISFGSGLSHTIWYDPFINIGKPDIIQSHIPTMTQLITSRIVQPIIL
jgi:hypothetical protein